MASPSLADFPRFSGQDGADINQYAAQMKRLLNFCKVAEADRPLFVTLTTDGVAQAVVQQYLEENPTGGYDDIMGHLRSLFQTRIDVSQTQQLLEARIKLPNETTQCYAAEVQVLCKKVDRNMPTAKIIDWVKRGLPTDIQRNIWQQDFASVADLTQTAEKFEAEMLRIQRNEAHRILLLKADPATDSETSKALQRVEEMIKQLFLNKEQPGVHNLAHDGPVDDNEGWDDNCDEWQETQPDLPQQR